MPKATICQNNYCSYWENGKCLLDSITVDENGMCIEFVYPEFPQEYLDQKREEQSKQEGKEE